MLKAMSVILICIAASPALSQSAAPYQVGTIIAVQTHKGAEGSGTSTSAMTFH